MQATEENIYLQCVEWYAEHRKCLWIHKKAITISQWENGQNTWTHTSSKRKPMTTHTDTPAVVQDAYGLHQVQQGGNNVCQSRQWHSGLCLEIAGWYSQQRKVSARVEGEGGPVRHSNMRLVSAFQHFHCQPLLQGFKQARKIKIRNPVSQSQTRAWGAALKPRPVAISCRITRAEYGKYKVLYNSQLLFQQRLYTDLDTILYHMHLCKPLTQLMKHVALHLRNTVMQKAFRTLTRYHPTCRRDGSCPPACGSARGQRSGPLRGSHCPLHSKRLGQEWSAVPKDPEPVSLPLYHMLSQESLRGRLVKWRQFIQTQVTWIYLLCLENIPE